MKDEYDDDDDDDDNVDDKEEQEDEEDEEEEEEEDDEGSLGWRARLKTRQLGLMRASTRLLVCILVHSY